MLAIAGGKGGCGKTTVALGLAAALARRGDAPLVIDADADMPDVHHRLGLDRGGTDALASGSSPERVATCSSELPGVAVVTGGRRRSLTTALRRLERWDGTVLIDSPAGANPDSLRPLRYADRTVLVSTDQPQCLEDTNRTGELCRRLEAPVCGVVVRSLGEDGLPAPLPCWRRLGTVPTVSEPISDPRARAVYDDVAATLSRGCHASVQSRTHDRVRPHR